MCLFTKTNSRPITAKKPVHIYKLLYLSPVRQQLVTPYMYAPVNFNKKGFAIQKAKIGEKERVSYDRTLSRIEQGIHAFRKLSIARDEANDFSIDKIFHAVIPAGATYYNDECHEEIVSNKIIIFETYELYQKYMAKWDK